ncbi:lysophosphatidylcholine acyltransferase 2-like isoform X2 [Oscarella lobularis]|uniref:lysophosphatidylcholine acyltransferase 2-like isoform X2 n=1 Tax=Oscarella lobularis TaxID=121494 RepID=UPI0033142F72
MAQRKSQPPLLRAASFAQGINPFSYDYENDLKLTVWQKLKIGFNTVLLLPLRVVFLVLAVVTAWLVSIVTMIGLSDTNQPHTGWRRRLSHAIPRLCRVILFGFGFWRVRTKGSCASRDEAPLIVLAPHSTYLDTFAAGMALPLPAVSVTKAANAKIPFIGSMLKAFQSIFVSRAERQSRNLVVNKIKERATTPGWPHVLIFPEGLCANRKALVKFKSGAFYPGLPVQPIIFRYPNKLDTVTWTFGGLSGAYSVYLTLCQFANFLEIEYLPVYKPSEEEKANPCLYASNVRKVMAKALELPTAEHSFEDVLLMMESQKLKMPLEAGIVEYHKLRDKLKMDLPQMKELISQFSEMDQNKDGNIDIKEFAAYLKLPITQELQDVFSMYDRNGDGLVNFREYVISMALISNPTNTEETLKCAFDLSLAV